MTGENPYAPPATTSAGMPDAPESFGWELEGKRVWVEKFAQFPRIDPYSGATEEEMTMNRLSVRVRPIWVSPLKWVLFALVLLGLSPLLHGVATFIGVVGLIVLTIVSARYPLTGLKVFFSGRTLRNRAIRFWVVKGSLMLAFLSGLPVGRGSVFPAWLYPDWIFTITLGIWLLGVIWQQAFENRLTCRRRKDGRFEIRGFHPKALERLAQEQPLK
jgi:hypothetical protein